MNSFAETLFPAARNHAEARIDYYTDLSQSILRSLRRVSEVNVQFSREALDDSITALGLKVIHTPIASPKANALCERLIGTIRRECLDWIIALSAKHLKHVLAEWQSHYNQGLYSAKTKSAK